MNHFSALAVKPFPAYWASFLFRDVKRAMVTLERTLCPPKSFVLHFCLLLLWARRGHRYIKPPSAELGITASQEHHTHKSPRVCISGNTALHFLTKTCAHKNLYTRELIYADVHTPEGCAAIITAVWNSKQIMMWPETSRPLVGFSHGTSDTFGCFSHTLELCWCLCYYH